MKLKAEQLDSHLARQLLPMYWIAGDETLLVEEAADRIRGKAREAQFNDRECYFVDKQFDWQTVMQSGNSLSLFADRKLMELRLGSPKLDDAGKKALALLLADPNPDTLILIISPKIETAAQKTKWFQQLEAAGAVIPVWPVNASQLPQWIMQRLQAQGITADREAIQLLCDRVEGNLLAASQEVEKLSLLMLSRGDDQRHLDARSVARSVADNARYNVFQMVDHALAGNARKALKSLSSLRNEGAEPLAILGVLSRDIRTVVNLSIQTRQGTPLNQAMQAERIWSSRQNLFRGTLDRIDDKQAAYLLRQARDVDLAVKGMNITPAWIAMEKLVLSLSGKSRFPSAPKYR